MEENDYMLGFTLGSNFNSYQKLCAYAQAMQNGHYLPISDDDIDRGVEYEKARQKLMKKLFKQIVPQLDMTGVDEAIDAYCDTWKARFKQFKANNQQK